MSEKNNKNQELLKLIHNYLDSNNVLALKSCLSKVHPSEIADVLESSTESERRQLWSHINSSIEGDVLSNCNAVVRNSLLQHMEPSRVASATNHLELDDVADILQDLPHELADEILLSMDDQNRSRLGAVLNYSADTAGGLMNVDAVTVRSDVDVDVVLRYMRQTKHIPENFDQVFVVDRGDVFLGALPLTTLVLASSDAKISDIMDVNHPAIFADTCLLYTSPSPRDRTRSRMPSSA